MNDHLPQWAIITTAFGIFLLFIRFFGIRRLWDIEPEQPISPPQNEIIRILLVVIGLLLLIPISLFVINGVINSLNPPLNPASLSGTATTQWQASATAWQATINAAVELTRQAMMQTQQATQTPSP